MERPLGGFSSQDCAEAQTFSLVPFGLYYGGGARAQRETLLCRSLFYDLHTCAHTTLTRPEPLFHPMPLPHHIPQDPVRIVGYSLWEVGGG